MYSENDEFVWELAERKLKNKASWQAKNAKRFLDKAWEGRSFDPAMAKFRALNALEEASCALVETLKGRHKNAGRINTTIHAHKMAVVAGLVLGQEALFQHVAFHLDQKRDLIHLRIGDSAGGEPAYMSSAMFGLQEGDIPEAGDLLQKRIEERFGDKNRFKELLEAEAKKRNDILYAEKSGLPDPKWEEPDDTFILRCKINATVAVGVACMVTQSSQPSPFVEQILSSIVNHLKLSEEEKARLEPPNLLPKKQGGNYR